MLVGFWGGGEGAVGLEFGGQGQEHLGADVGELQLCGDAPEVFDGPGPSGAAVADESDGLVVPFGVEVVQGVLQRCGDGVVVFGGDDDVAVEGGDLRCPASGVVLAVVAAGRGERFVQEGQCVVRD